MTGKVKSKETQIEELLEELSNLRQQLALKEEEFEGKLSKSADNAKTQARTLKIFFENTITPLVILDAEYNFIMVNEACAKAFKRDISGFNEKNLFEFYPPEIKKIFNKVLLGTVPYQAFATPIYFPDYPERATTYWDWTLVPIVNMDAEVDFLILSLLDVSDKKNAEIALSETNTLHSALGEALSNFITDTAPNDLFDTLLDTLLKVTKSEHGFIGQVLYDKDGSPYLKNFTTSNIAWDETTRAFYEENATEGLEFHKMDNLFGRVITSGAAVISNDIPHDKRSGGLPSGHPPLKTFMGLPCYVHKKLLVGIVALANRAGGYDNATIEKLNPLLSTCANIIEAYRNDNKRREAEEALRTSKELLQSVLDNSTTVVYVKDLSGRYLLINKVYEERFHITKEEILGKTAHDVFPRDMADAFRASDLEVIEKGRAIEFEEIAPHNDGPHTYLSVKFPIKDGAGKFNAVCGIATDITERMRMEEDRLKMQKFESIGVLAGGIAHDFNNLLTGILGNISFSMMKLDPGDPICARLKEAERASLFARDLTRQLLTFSKGGTPVKKTISVEQFLEAPVEFALRGSNERCEYFIEDDLPCIEADKGQLNQVINNLIINADQAMPSGGVIKVSARLVCIEGKDKLPLKEGLYVKIEVEDTGIGIPEENLPNIFDPYFTTKQEGSGLGLTSVYSIIRNHEGHVEVSSEQDVGTVFALYLPVSKKTIEKTEREEDFLLEGHGRILVMDDEEIIRNLLGEFLKQLGYDSLCVADGEQAIEQYTIAEANSDPFDAVVMDLTIQGGMGGEETIKKLLHKAPNAKVIVSSGYSNDPVVANFSQYGFRGYLNKPYNLPDLGKVLHKAINSKPQTGGNGSANPSQ